MRIEAEDGTGSPASVVRVNSTYSIDIVPDQAIYFTIFLTAPEYSAETGTPASDQYKLILAGSELGGGSELGVPPSFYLEIIKPDIAVNSVILPGMAILSGQPIEVTAEIENFGNYAQNVVVYFYYADTDGKLLSGGSSPWPSTRMTKFGAATVELIEPAEVLAGQDKPTTKTVSAIWENPETPVGAGTDYTDVEVYVWANPLGSEIDEQGEGDLYDNKDEEQTKRSNNFEDGKVRIVRVTLTTPSFGLAVWGLALAGVIAALGTAWVRRRD